MRGTTSRWTAILVALALMVMLAAGLSGCHRRHRVKKPKGEKAATDQPQGKTAEEPKDAPAK